MKLTKYQIGKAPRNWRSEQNYQCRRANIYIQKTFVPDVRINSWSLFSSVFRAVITFKKNKLFHFPSVSGLVYWNKSVSHYTTYLLPSHHCIPRFKRKLPIVLCRHCYRVINNNDNLLIFILLEIERCMIRDSLPPIRLNLVSSLTFH